MAGLDERDMQVLGHYADKGNRTLYWNYLAQHAGNDGYGLLALGVVRNDSMPGAVANAFAQNHANRHLSEREWENFGQDLIQQDYALRQRQMDKEHRPDRALNLPVEDVQEAHDKAFTDYQIDPNAWTPRQLLEAARRQGGEGAAEGVWDTMLDSKALGAERMVATLGNVAWKYNDEKLSAVAYTASLTAATVLAAADRSNVDPNVVGGVYSYNMYFDKESTWANVSTMGGGVRQITDPNEIARLNDDRAVRMERQQKATQFDPRDPNKDLPLAKSPFTFADNGHDIAPATQLAGPSRDPAAPRGSVDDLFTRLTDAAMARDGSAMRGVGQEFVQSDAGQNWLQAGREHNQEGERQAALAVQKNAQEIAFQQAAPVHTGPVMRM